MNEQPRFTPSNSMSAVSRQASATSAEQRGWRTDIARVLLDDMVNVVRIRHHSDHDIRFRLDVVTTQRPEVWVTLMEPRIEVAVLVEPSLPRTLQAERKFPLRPWTAPLGPPPLLMWSRKDAFDASELMHELALHHLGADCADMRISMDECSPLEADRRRQDRRLVEGLRSRHGARGPAVTACANCGRPLSDKESARLGIGPECRRRLGHLLPAVHSRQAPSTLWYRSKKPKAWLAQVLQDMRG